MLSRVEHRLSKNEGDRIEERRLLHRRHRQREADKGSWCRSILVSIDGLGYQAVSLVTCQIQSELFICGRSIWRHRLPRSIELYNKYVMAVKYVS